MSGSGPTPAEQHLGDRLAALVDGELKHDARDRVLAHLATCHRCKAEADSQRRLKNVFAHAAPPPPSEGLLARLQGLPAGPGSRPGSRPGGDDDRRGDPFEGEQLTDGVFTALNPSAGHGLDDRTETFGYVPAGMRAGLLPGGSGGAGRFGGSGGSGGFRVHDVGRTDAERSPWRGRRFAFAAASAVSFAAIALGGALPADSSGQTGPRGEGAGNNVTPLRTATPTAANPSLGGGVGNGVNGGSATEANLLRSAEAERRRNQGNGIARSQSRPTIPEATGLLAPAAPLNHPFSVPVLTNSSSSLSPLIVPAGAAIVPTHLAAPIKTGGPVSSHR
ncbi:anti-sigma factor family protein [Streptomyces sp. NPDC052236]|uniref:anti-sigma factor family protein n=1 Tax=Streptomyces sp. NPDC052236 TaxID=3365686 RepID=UPI0037D38FE5